MYIRIIAANAVSVSIVEYGWSRRNEHMYMPIDIVRAISKVMIVDITWYGFRLRDTAVPDNQLLTVP